MSIRTLIFSLTFFGVFLLGIAFLVVRQNEFPSSIEKKFVFEVSSAFSAGIKASGTTLLISSVSGPPYNYPDQSGSLDRVVHEAFRRLRIDVNVITLPSERSLQSADTGIIDGDMLRISGLESDYPHLVMVPEKLTDYEFVAFSRRKDLSISNWESLCPYSVGIEIGRKYVERNAINIRSLIKVGSREQLFQILDLGRVDLVVYPRETGIQTLHELNLSGIACLEPPLATMPVFLYLNQKHASLTVLLAETFRGMKKDGTWEKLTSGKEGDR
ncbi:MAG: ABC transporter substrate-binding protein [Candidatus Ozemobacteraceae bacterium]